MRKSEKEAGRLGPASLGRKRPGRAHPQPYVGPRMLRTPLCATNGLLCRSVAHRHWNAPGNRYCPGVLAQFFRTHREQFFHFRCPRGCWWRNRWAATAHQGGPSAVAALEPDRCEGPAGSWGCLTRLLGALGSKGGRVDIRPQLMSRHPGDPFHVQDAERRDALPLRKSLRSDPQGFC